MWVKYLVPNSFVFGKGNGTPLQYSCLENPMDKGAWKAVVHEVAKSRTWLSDFTFTFHFHALEKEIATYSSVLAWRIAGMGEPDGLPSMGSHRVGHDWSDLAAAAAVCIFKSVALSFPSPFFLPTGTRSLYLWVYFCFIILICFIFKVSHITDNIIYSICLSISDLLSIVAFFYM